MPAHGASARRRGQARDGVPLTHRLAPPRLRPDGTSPREVDAMTRVAFGISFGSGTPLPHREDTQKLKDLVRMAEDAGAEALGTYDTAFIGGDAFVRATLIAAASTRARVGLRPTNPITREPQVMASFLA